MICSAPKDGTKKMPGKFEIHYAQSERGMPHLYLHDLSMEELLEEFFDLRDRVHADQIVIKWNRDTE